MDSAKPLYSEVRDLKISCLGVPKIVSPLRKDNILYTQDDDLVSVYADTKSIDQYLSQNKTLPHFEAAGPREKIFFNPKKINCGIVTCGGLCPGLNDAIRTVTLSLIWQYGVKKVFGFRFGYQGLSSKALVKPLELTPDVVDEIQHEGGTILGSSRGPQNIKDMVNNLVKYKIKILFAVGGDGTFRAAHEIAREVKRKNLDISIIGIPKTIDNDIYCSEKTFGFSTAVGEARRAIYTAHEEAKAAWNGIGLVKLMGRDSGFIAAHATLANSDVNFCLVPESPFVLEGKCGFLDLLEKRLNKRHHAVIVVAEGAGQHLVDESIARQTDESGNIRYKDIGVFLKARIKEYFERRRIPATIKYIDPSYMIRSCPANSDDSAFCLMLGQNAVHAGIAGKTDMFIGYWNHRFTHVPLTLATLKKKKLDTTNMLWQTLLETTGQQCSLKSPSKK